MNLNMRFQPETDESIQNKLVDDMVELVSTRLSSEEPKKKPVREKDGIKRRDAVFSPLVSELQRIKSDMTRTVVGRQSKARSPFLRKSTKIISKNLGLSISLFLDIKLNLSFGISFANFYVLGVFNDAYDKRNFYKLKSIKFLTSKYVKPEDSFTFKRKKISSELAERFLRLSGVNSAILEVDSRYITVAKRDGQFIVLDSQDQSHNGTLLVDTPCTIAEISGQFKEPI